MNFSDCEAQRLAYLRAEAEEWFNEITEILMDLLIEVDTSGEMEVSSGGYKNIAEELFAAGKLRNHGDFCNSIFREIQSSLPDKFRDLFRDFLGTGIDVKTLGHWFFNWHQHNDDDKRRIKEKVVNQWKKFDEITDELAHEISNLIGRYHFTVATQKKEPPIYKEVFSPIVNFIKSLPNLWDSDGQRAFLLRAGVDNNLLNQVSFGLPQSIFSLLLVEKLTRYGTLADGRHALEAVLEAAKELVGPEKQALCDKLINDYFEHIDDNATVITSNEQ